MFANRPLDLSKLAPNIEQSSPRSPSSPPNPKDPYQIWATSSGSHAKKIRTELETTPQRKTSDSATRTVRNVWNTRRVCDLESNRLSRQARHDMLKLVRIYHSYVSGMVNGSWEVLDYDIAVKFKREDGKDTLGLVYIFHRDQSVDTFEGVSGDHLYKILEIMIAQHA